MKALHSLLWLALSFMLVSSAVASTGAVLEEHQIPAAKAGLSLYVRHRAPPAARPKAAKPQVVLLVHGAFFPASAGFDVDLPGGSVLAQLAARGLSVYTLDVRGYGRSTRPAFMQGPIGEYEPFATTAEAIADVAAGVEFIRQREGVEAVSLVGWSWGSAIVGGFAEQHPERVAKLVLFAPAWLPREPPPVQPFGNYRTFDHDGARARVLNGVPEARVEEIHPSAWFERFWALNLSLDRDGAARKPPVVRAPSGVSQDFVDFWRQGKPTWDPARVRAATLVIVGEWDKNTPPEMARQIHERLTHAAARQLTILPEATHFVILEKNRNLWLDEVSRFLSKP